MKTLSLFLISFILLIAFSCQKNNDNQPTGVTQDTITISRISPSTGPYGTSVSISGGKFSTDTNKLAVTFNGAKAMITFASEDSIVAVVPKGAGTGNLKVMVQGAGVVGPVFTYILSATVSTVAGNGVAGFMDGDTSVAEFNYPTGIRVDSAGNIYVSDTHNNRIRKISHGQVSTMAGTGVDGYLDGPSTIAMISKPLGMSMDKEGNLYVADGYNIIRKISPAGDVAGFAGSGGHGAGPGYLDGKTTDAEFNGPYGVATDATGANVYVADVFNSRVRKVSAGWVSTFGGNGTPGHVDGAGTISEFFFPTGIVMDSHGNLFITDQFNFCIRKIGVDSSVSTLAGTGIRGEVDGPIATAQFDYLNGIALDAAGNIYVVQGNTNRIRKVGTDGMVTTIAGNDEAGSVDGNALTARFNTPVDLAIDAQGNIYVSEAGGNRIRKIEIER